MLHNVAERSYKAPENYFGISDSLELENLAGVFAARRLAELEANKSLTKFTRATLLETHRYLMQDVYPWAGSLRTSEVGAMGITMCRADFVDSELDRVMKQISEVPVSQNDKATAVNTVAEHWSELTIVHPFLDGNSRTQRFFFDQMFRSAGWTVDWTQVNAAEIHAARYVGAATTDSSYLAQVLLPGTLASDQLSPKKSGRMLSMTQDSRDAVSSVEIFHKMMAHRRNYPDQPWYSNTSGVPSFDT